MKNDSKESANEEQGMGAARATEPRPAIRAGEEDIIEAIGEGAYRKALKLCARTYGPVIGRLCMSMVGSQADAEDLTQETLLDAYDGFAGFRGEGTLRAWVLCIARRKCARWLEKRARRTAKLRLVHDADKNPPASGGTESEVLLRQRAVQAREALAEVRPTEREALLLRYGAALSFREVAEACGIEEAAARKRVSRAIATLRRSMVGSTDEEGS